MRGGGLLDCGDEGGADDGGVGEAAENGDVAGEGYAEAYGDGKLREGTGAAHERMRVLGAVGVAR